MNPNLEPLHKAIADSVYDTLNGTADKVWKPKMIDTHFHDSQFYYPTEKPDSQHMFWSPLNE